MGNINLIISFYGLLQCGPWLLGAGHLGTTDYAPGVLGTGGENFFFPKLNKKIFLQKKYFFQKNFLFQMKVFFKKNC